MKKFFKKTTVLRNNGRKERQEDYLTVDLLLFTAISFESMVVFLCVFIAALFLSYFQVHPYLKGSFFQKLFGSCRISDSIVAKAGGVVYNHVMEQ